MGAIRACDGNRCASDERDVCADAGRSAHSSGRVIRRSLLPVRADVRTGANTRAARNATRAAPWWASRYFRLERAGKGWTLPDPAYRRSGVATDYGRGAAIAYEHGCARFDRGHGR